MVDIGQGFFVHFPTASRQRILHPGKIIGIKNRIYTAALEEPELIVEVDQNILLYYDARDGFVQQPGRIECVVETAPKLVVCFVTTGEPASAESREHYRVSTVMSDVVVDVGSEANCKVLDVSVAGMSTITETSYGLGLLLNVRLIYDSQEFTGRICVQSVRRLSDGRTRCGLLCTAEPEDGEDLREGLRHVSMTIQRKQLRRLAGAT